MIYDIVFIIIILISLFIGYKKGVARMLLSLFGSAASFLLSVLLGEYFSKLVYDNHIAPSVVDSLSRTLAISSSGYSDVFESLPPFVRFALNFTDTSYTDVVLAVDRIPQTLAENIEKAIAPVVTSLLAFIFTALIFIAVLFLFKLVVKHIVVAVFNIPVLKTVNKLLGSLCAVVIGLLFVSFFAFLLHLIMPYLNNVPYIFSESTIYNSYIFYYFYSGNIFDTIISIF